MDKGGKVLLAFWQLINLYKITYGAIFVFALLLFGRHQRFWPYLLIYLLIITLDFNPLFVSRWQVVLFYFALIVLSNFIQTRSFEQTLMNSSLTYLNLYLIDGFYSLLSNLISIYAFYFYPLFFVLSCGLLWLLSKIELQGISKLILKNPAHKQRILAGLFILTLILLAPPIYQTLVELSGENSQITQFILMINLTIFLLFLVGLAILNYGLKQIKKAEREMANSKINQEYAKMMETQYTEIRKFRHDYKNVLLGLEGIIQSQDWTSLKNFLYQELAQGSQQIQSEASELERLIYIKNPELKNILYSKLSYALSHQIEIHVEVTENIPSIDHHLLDLIRMMGIILDNAIEECQKYQQAKLEVLITPLEAELLIVIANSTEIQAKDLAKINQLGFSSKGENRGLGLVNLKELADHAQIELYTSVEHHQFIQELYIPITAQEA